MIEEEDMESHSPPPRHDGHWAVLCTPKVLMLGIAENIRPGLTVAFVSLPLSISLAVASQATPGMGTATAIYGGLFGALVGGSSYNIQGPTGALSPILAWYSVSYGQQILPWLAIGAGILSLIAFIVRLDGVAQYMSQVVMEGFNLGVAITNIMNVLPYGLGIDGLYKHRHLHNNILEMCSNLMRAEPFQSSITLIGFVGLMQANRWRPKFPWFLCLATVSMIFGYMVENDSRLVGLVQSYSSSNRDNSSAFPLLLMNDRYPPLKDNLWSPPRFEEIQDLEWSVIINGSMSVMLLAVFETLISAKLADSRTQTKSDTRMELIGVGFGNLACGIVGGFPCTAALARTNLNIRKGATSRLSAIVSAVGVLGIVNFASESFMYLPLPVVAAMMLTVNFGMPNWSLIAVLAKSKKKELLIVLLVAAVCIMLDPGIALLIGISMEYARFSDGATKSDYKVDEDTQAEEAQL